MRFLGPSPLPKQNKTIQKVKPYNIIIHKTEKYNNKEKNLSSIHESPLTMLIPSCLLAIGAILTGILFKEMFIGHDRSQFWSSSILFLQSINYTHPPNWFLLLTPSIVISSITIS